MLMTKNKIYNYNYFYIKLEFYLNLIIIEDFKLEIFNSNLNLIFFKKKILNKFFLKLKFEKKILCLYYFNYNNLSNFIKSNNLVLIKSIYSKKYTKNNILLNRLNCFYIIFKFLKNFFIFILKFLNFIKKNE